jgi:uncharacterized protein YprB with RNaseH-like and TPR domain
VSKLKDKLGRLEMPALGGRNGPRASSTGEAALACGAELRAAAAPADPAPAHGRAARIAELRAQLARVGSRLRGGPAPPARVRSEREHDRGYATARNAGGEPCAAPHVEHGDEAHAAAPFEDPAAHFGGGAFTRRRDETCARAGGGLPGEGCETALGPLRSVVALLPEDHRHGAIPLALALEASAQDLALLALDPGLAASDFRRALFIDTETTGLAGGAGTLPFVIGMAWFEQGCLRVEQLLLERPGLEAPMLARLAERLREASAVVSFNGKSFDWPLLRTRFVLQRVAAPPLPPHLDLLHCARRVYKRRLGSVRLVHLEEQILGFTRIEDIAGELIPQTYLGFLRGQVPGAALAPILEHNRSDLVALAAMLGELTRRFRGERPEEDARDQLGFAGVAARARAHERALAFARGAAAADLRGELAPEAHCLVAELCLRAGDLAAAERALLLAVEAACGDPTRAGRAHLSLAKLYEHRLKRFERALEHAERARCHEGAQASERRRARLRAKQRRSEGGSLA